MPDEPIPEGVVLEPPPEPEENNWWADWVLGNIGPDGGNKDRPAVEERRGNIWSEDAQRLLGLLPQAPPPDPEALGGSKPAESEEAPGDRMVACPVCEGQGQLPEKVAERVKSKPARGERECLPGRRRSVNQKARLNGQALYFSFGFYPDGRVGEVWIDLMKTGSALRAWACAAAKMISISIQYGMPMDELVDAFAGMVSEPWGAVVVEGLESLGITRATGVLDLIVRVLAVEYLGRVDLKEPPSLEG